MRLLLLTTAVAISFAQQQPSTTVVANAEMQPALRPIEDVPGLPRVLLIGDSISIGYTLPAREMLKGRANVHRIPANGATTARSLENIEKWLGEKTWDVIHANWGLHDLRIMDDGKHQVPIATYEQNLEQLAVRLKKAAKHVLYATTTPVPEGKVSPPRVPADVARYNEAAIRVMRRHSIPVNDLYAAMQPNLAEYQRPVNVHFNDAGSAFLASHVAREIGNLLPQAQPATGAKPHESFRWVNAIPSIPGVHHATYFSPMHQVNVGYAVYLPPDYEQSQRRYPVIYYLHGGRPGGENKSVRMAATFDRHIRAGTVPPAIYVFVNGGAVSHYDYPELRSFGEGSFIHELIPHIDANYRTIAAKNGRGLEGFSQGGRGTARIAFKYPQYFCSAAPMGGGHQHEKRASENQGREGTEDGYSFAPGHNTWDLAKTYALGKERVRLLVAVGTKDFNYEANLAWMDHLKKLGLTFERRIVEGVEHNAQKVYDQVGADAMRFHADCFAASR
ncbi:MAG: hypothetical protein JNL98_04515 [Bryobacterales bacterium]|nr:hypothetical protein [Bryobacterales bacterium]